MIKLNGETILTEKFPNNETKVKDFDISKVKSNRNIIEFEYESNEDLISLMFVKKRLDEQYVKCILFMRDMKCSKYVAKFIECLRFMAVYTPKEGSEITIDELEKSVDSCDNVKALSSLLPVCNWFDKVKNTCEYVVNDHIMFKDGGTVLRTILNEDRVSARLEDMTSIKFKNNILEFKYKSDEDLIDLMFAKMALDESDIPCKLFIWYMPYSRMDRKIEGDLFTLMYVCNFVGALDFESIYIMEPHSIKTENRFKIASIIYSNNTKVYSIYPACDWLSKVQEEIGFTENDHIVFPDKGAAARYEDKKYDNICIMEKKRDPATGQILDMKLKEGHVNPGSKCIIIDDLCSKGGTFAWAASILKNLGASEVYLIVTHCEETIFAGTLLSADSPIEKVYTSTSMMSEKHPKIQYMDVDVKSYIN